MKKHLLVKTALSGLFATLCTVGIVSFPGCQKQDYDYSEKDDLDPALLNAPELEEYIIASAEYRYTMDLFQIEIKKVDLLNLKFVKGANGEKIAYLPISVDIEDKIRNLKEKEDILFRRYPQFTALTKNTKKDYVRNCIKNSLNVNKKLLELGININQPMTKGGTSEAFGNMEDLTNYLTEEMSSSTYREIVIIVYKDGRIVTYQDDANTYTYYQVKLKKVTNTITGNSKYYYPETSQNDSDEIAYMAHTQKSGFDPTDLDMEQAGKWDGLDMRIYHDGAFRQFDKYGLVYD